MVYVESLIKDIPTSVTLASASRNMEIPSTTATVSKSYFLRGVHFAYWYEAQNINTTAYGTWGRVDLYYPGYDTNGLLPRQTNGTPAYEINIAGGATVYTGIDRGRLPISNAPILLENGDSVQFIGYFYTDIADVTYTANTHYAWYIGEFVEV